MYRNLRWRLLLTLAVMLAALKSELVGIACRMTTRSPVRVARMSRKNVGLNAPIHGP